MPIAIGDFWWNIDLGLVCRAERAEDAAIGALQAVWSQPAVNAVAS